MKNPETDALRLVPIERIQFAIDAIAHLKPEKARFALEQMLAAAPASPLPGGGDEALIAELKEARALLGCWLETFDLDGVADMKSATRAFLARKGKGEG